jgi:hypothetical protein
MMADIAWAVARIREGKAVRRPSWGAGWYIARSSALPLVAASLWRRGVEQYSDRGRGDEVIDGEDLMAADWELANL